MTAPVRWVAALWPFLLCIATLPAAGAPQDARVHLCGDRTLFLLSHPLWPEPEEAESYRVTVFEVPKDVPTMVAERVAGRDPVKEVATVPGAWIQVGTMIRAPLPVALQGGRNYLVHLDLVAGGGATRVGIGELSTGARAVAVPSGASLEASYTIELYSRTPLADLPNEVDVIEVVRPAGVMPVGANGARAVRPIVRRHTACRDRGGPTCCGDAGSRAAAAPPAGSNDACTTPDTTAQAPGGFPSSSGALYCLPPGTRLERGSHELRIDSLRDVFGQEVEAKGPVPQPVVPKGKDDARYYVSAQFESAEGVADSLALDLKLRPALQLRGAWLYRPELTASLARNLPRSSDSVRLASLFARSWLFDEGFLRGHTLSVGPSAEADRDLDRINALLDLRWEPELRNLYRPRELRRQRLANQPKLKGQRVYLPPWGWGLRTWVGLEAGGSVKDQTVDGGAGKADLELPRYEILRVKTQVQAFVEYRRFILNLSSGVRYLATDESVARSTPDGELFLVELDEARPYTEVTLSFAVDPTRNVALALAYKDGSEPPDYQRVDKYTLGFVAKY